MHRKNKLITWDIYMKQNAIIADELFVKIYHNLIDILYAESHLRKR